MTPYILLLVSKSDCFQTTGLNQLKSMFQDQWIDLTTIIKCLDRRSFFILAKISNSAKFV